MGLSVLIVGAGKIGALADESFSKSILSHAHAFKNNKAFDVIDFVDVRESSLYEAILRWGGRGFFSVAEAMRIQGRYDVVVNATSTDQHLSTIRAIVELDKLPRLIFTEKPLASSLLEAEELCQLLSFYKVPCLVNYSRRFIHEYQLLKKMIEDGYLGDFIGGYACYGKGIIHNGSHLIDILLFLFGKDAVKSGDTLNFEFDYQVYDPSISGYLFVREKIVFLQAVSHEYYTVFDLELLFSKGKLVLSNLGMSIEIYFLENHDIHQGHRILKLNESWNIAPGNSLAFAVNHIKNFLNGVETQLLCDEKSALQAFLLTNSMVERGCREKNSVFCP